MKQPQSNKFQFTKLPLSQDCMVFHGDDSPKALFLCSDWVADCWAVFGVGQLSLDGESNEWLGARGSPNTLSSAESDVLRKCEVEERGVEPIWSGTAYGITTDFSYSLFIESLPKSAPGRRSIEFCRSNVGLRLDMLRARPVNQRSSHQQKTLRQTQDKSAKMQFVVYGL